MSFRQVQLYDLPLWEQLIRNRKPKNSCVTVMAFRLWGGWWMDFKILPSTELITGLCSVGCRAHICAQGGTVHSVEFFSRIGEWSSTYTEVLVCLGWNEQWNHPHLSRQVEGQWGLTEELLATKVKEWAVTLKHFYLPHAWHRKKHDYKQNVLTLYCQKPIFCYSHSDRITCRLLSLEELRMGKSLIKHKVMCIFLLSFKITKMPNKS